MSTLKVPQRSFYFASASYLVQMYVVLDVAGDCECDVDCINVERQSHTHTPMPRGSLTENCDGNFICMFTHPDLRCLTEDLLPTTPWAHLIIQ